MTRVATFKMPNAIILTPRVTPMGKKVAALLYSRCNAHGALQKTQEELATLAHCSVPSVRKACGELVREGYLAIEKPHVHYDSTQEGFRSTKSVYVLLHKVEDSFTFVPRSALQDALTGSCMSIFLYLLLSMGNKTRAFPSLSLIATTLSLSIPTVTKGLKRLKNHLIHAEHCIKKNNSYACNSYFLLMKRKTQDCPKAEQPCAKEAKFYGFLLGGRYLKNFLLYLRLKITMAFTLGRNYIGARKNFFEKRGERYGKVQTSIFHRSHSARGENKTRGDPQGSG